MAAKPITATIFAYQVGFGDCFLLTFTYDDGGNRHILIDFGSTGKPKDDHLLTMDAVAADIAGRCGGSLDAVVATHRHADHISGFTTGTGGDKASGDAIRALSPKRVIQPWTEAPDAPENWEGPEDSASGKAFALRRKSLDAMHSVAQAVVLRLDAKQLDSSDETAARLRFIGEDNIKNVSAVKNLMTMADRPNQPKGANNAYVFHGSDAGLGSLLPGVKVHVLGPPTLLQTQTIKKQVSKSADQFWLQAQGMLGLGSTSEGVAASALFPGLGKADTFPGSRLPTEMRWMAARVDRAESQAMLGIVTALDKAMNNTSVILLFEAGSKKLLFPGDAQLENWTYALGQKWVTDLLADVDLYKVGHHGSLNATPKSMWNAFTKRSKKRGAGRLTSVMSTMAGKHGGKHGGPTEVPREPLVDALTAETDHYNTQDLPNSTAQMPAPCQIVTIDLR